jgi:hypothetical protein
LISNDTVSVCAAIAILPRNEGTITPVIRACIDIWASPAFPFVFVNQFVAVVAKFAAPIESEPGSQGALTSNDFSRF